MSDSPSYISIDPGVSTGWVTWDDKGTMLAQGTSRSVEEFDTFLHTLPSIPVVIVEEFRLFKNKALQQSGSRMETSQVIGIIRSWARRNKAEVIEQQAQILSIAQLWSGMKMPSNHSVSHWVSAYNHGFYYLVKKGVRKLELRTDPGA